jgi:predicted nucleotidyltransferase
MPVRSLNSSVLRWPDAQIVDRAVRAWVESNIKERQDILEIGYFGSYAQGKWGVGSDIDILIILENSDKPFIYRASEWDTGVLPVPTDVLVYTKEEWNRLCFTSEFHKKLKKDTIWVYSREKTESV